MDARRNPYTPGAGTRPEALVGRDELIGHIDVMFDRLAEGRHEQSYLITGLRGVGKTVLLGEFERIAKSKNWVTQFHEVTRSSAFPSMIARLTRKTLLELSAVERAKDRALRALGALRGFSLRLSGEGLELGYDVERVVGVADSGNLQDDLTDLFVEVGETARECGRGVVYILDEVQMLEQEPFEALIAALHRAGKQLNLPLTVIGAGLPTLPSLAAEAKSYSERLFLFPLIDRLSPDAARAALVEPAANEGVAYSDDALARVIAVSERYPYFLQEYGKWTWLAAETSPIQVDDVERGAVRAQASLDESFFRARYDRVSDGERHYLCAMAALPKTKRRSGTVAEQLDAASTSLSPVRDSLIKKGLIYSARRGEIDFTVPQSDAYLKRRYPRLTRRARPNR